MRETSFDLDQGSSVTRNRIFWPVNVSSAGARPAGKGAKITHRRLALSQRGRLWHPKIDRGPASASVGSSPLRKFGERKFWRGGMRRRRWLARGGTRGWSPHIEQQIPGPAKARRGYSEDAWLGAVNDRHNLTRFKRQDANESI